MAKTYPIKWKKSDYNKLRSAISSFNRAVNKAAKGNMNQVYSPYLPELKKYSEVKANILTRAEYNRIIKELGRVKNKGALEMVFTVSGDPTTKWQLAETRRQAGILKKSLRKQLDELPIPEPNTMGSEERREIMAQIRDITFFETKKGFERKKLWESIQKKGTLDYEFKMKIQFKENYLEALRKEYSTQLNFDELYQYLASKNPHEFWDFIKDNNLVDFLSTGWYQTDHDKYYQLLIKTGLNYVEYPNKGKAYLKEKFKYKANKGKRQDVRVSYTDAEKMDIDYIEYAD